MGGPVARTRPGNSLRLKSLRRSTNKRMRRKSWSWSSRSKSQSYMSRRKPLLIVARNFCPALSSCTMEVGPVVGQYVWSFAAWSFDIGLSWLSEQLWEAAARFVFTTLI